MLPQKLKGKVIMIKNIQTTGTIIGYNITLPFLLN